MPVRAILALDGIKFTSNIIPDSPTIGVKIGWSNGVFYLLDEYGVSSSSDSKEELFNPERAKGIGNANKYWMVS